MTPAFAIEPLAPAHRRKGFCCGVAELDYYLSDLVDEHVARGLGGCFATLGEMNVVVGYYTLSAVNLPLGELPPEVRERLPRRPLLAAAWMGRLAVDRRFRGQGFGGAMIMDAAARSARAEPKAHALIVDAKDQIAAAFYRRLEFRRLLSCPGALFLPLATAVGALAGEGSWPAPGNVRRFTG